MCKLPRVVLCGAGFVDFGFGGGIANSGVMKQSMSLHDRILLPKSNTLAIRC